MRAAQGTVSSLLWGLSPAQRHKDCPEFGLTQGGNLMLSEGSSLSLNLNLLWLTSCVPVNKSFTFIWFPLIYKGGGPQLFKVPSGLISTASWFLWLMQGKEREDYMLTL